MSMFKNPKEEDAEWDQLLLLLGAPKSKTVILNGDWVCRVENIDTSAATFDGGVAFINGYPYKEGAVEWP